MRFFYVWPLCRCSTPAMLHAQYRTSIQGVVTDPAGAVIPGATLTLTNNGTGEKQVRASDASGVTTSMRCQPISLAWSLPRTDSRRKIFFSCN